MVVRFLVVWLALGLGGLVGCGGTKKQPPTEAPGDCTPPRCPNDCDPSSKFCLDDTVWRCSAKGDSATALQVCSDSETCDDAGQLTSCKPMSDGSGGAPAVVACVPGARQCAGSQVQVCSQSGTALELYESCDEGQACDPSALACLPTLCEPGAAFCLGTQRAACSESGTAIEPLADCVAEGKACEAGECVDRQCEPFSKWCEDNTVLQCDATGLSQTSFQTCTAMQHCVLQAVSPSNAYCLPNSCVAGEKVCNGNLVAICSEDGTIPSEGTDCGDEVCAEGECKTPICEPFARMCLEGELHECTNYGVDTKSIDACTEGRCLELAGGAACGPLACAPGETVCLGNALGTCTADGEGLVQVTQDCASAQQVCNTTPACAASAVDALGAAEKVEHAGADEILGAIIDVHSDRLLTKLEAHLVLESARDLRWVVYELKAEGSFELVASEVTTNNTGSQFFSTQELSWGLEAGKRYVFGVGLVVFEGYFYYDEPPYDASLSFGNVVGGTRNAYAASMFFDVNASFYRIRATTELP